jgi:hypothetical protein
MECFNSANTDTKGEVSMEWQPIETAPKDETRVLTVISGFEVCIGWWFIDAGKWMTMDAEDYDDDGSWEYSVENTEYYPTHWMPLPGVPATK